MSESPTPEAVTGLLDLDEAMAVSAPSADVDVVALDDALTALGAIDPRGARIVELRFFSGLTIEETAEVLGVSPGTIKREWSSARAVCRCQVTAWVSESTCTRAR